MSDVPRNVSVWSTYSGQFEAWNTVEENTAVIEEDKAQWIRQQRDETSLGRIDSLDSLVDCDDVEDSFVQDVIHKSAETDPISSVLTNSEGTLNDRSFVFPGGEGFQHFQTLGTRREEKLQKSIAKAKQKVVDVPIIAEKAGDGAHERNLMAQIQKLHKQLLQSRNKDSEQNEEYSVGLNIDSESSITDDDDVDISDTLHLVPPRSLVKADVVSRLASAGNKKKKFRVSKKSKLNTKNKPQTRKVKHDRDKDRAIPVLVVVSHRLPVRGMKNPDTGKWDFQISSGGLVAALAALHSPKRFCWVGWLGVSVPLSEQEEVRSLLVEKFSCYPVFIPDEVSFMHYEGFCSSILWPLFHYVPLLPTTLAPFRYFDRKMWTAYTKVNSLFAIVIEELLSPGGIADCTLENHSGGFVWVHDYHLCLLPSLLRQKFPNLIIGWFLHIPFPTSEIYRMLPVRTELLQGILAADIIGFHTYDYARHFQTSCTRILALENTAKGVEYRGRTASLGVYPVGIDIELWASICSRESVQLRTKELARQYIQLNASEFTEFDDVTTDQRLSCNNTRGDNFEESHLLNENNVPMSILRNENVRDSIVSRANRNVDMRWNSTDFNNIEITLDNDINPTFRERIDGHEKKPLKILLGVDRLDLIKGIPHKLLAYETFLLRHPEWLGNVVLIQVTVPVRSPSTQVQQLQKQIEGLVGRINGRFGALHYTPVHYLNSAPSSEELAALYLLADVCLVTPVRDGMNLVSQEFLACKWHANKVSRQHAKNATLLGSSTLGSNDRDLLIRNRGTKTNEKEQSKIRKGDLRNLDGRNDIDERLKRKDSELDLPISCDQELVGSRGAESDEENANVEEEEERRGLAHQDFTCKPGVVIISEFAGSAQSLGAALRINPWNTMEVAQAIKEALSMTRKECTFRHSRLYRTIAARQTCQFWADSFVSDMMGAAISSRALETLPLPQKAVRLSYERTRRRLFLIDYGGTLALRINDDGDRQKESEVEVNSNEHFSEHFNELNENLNDGNIQGVNEHELRNNSSNIDIGSIQNESEFEGPSPKLQRCIASLCQDPRNLVVIVSGESAGTMEKWFPSHSVGLAADNGTYLRYPFLRGENEKNTWRTLGRKRVAAQWKSAVLPVMQFFLERTPGSRLVESDTSLAWHYADADLDFGTYQAKDMQMYLADVIARLHCTVTRGNQVVEVRQEGIDKGTLLSELLSVMAHEHELISNDGSREWGGLSERRSNKAIEREKGIQYLNNFLKDMGEKNPVSFEINGMISKMRATSQRHGLADFVFCAGDDYSDERVFSVLNSVIKENESLANVAQSKDSSGTATTTTTATPDAKDKRVLTDGASTYSCHIGATSSKATYRLENPSELLDFLCSLPSLSL